MIEQVWMLKRIKRATTVIQWTFLFLECKAHYTFYVFSDFIFKLFPGDENNLIVMLFIW